jgi:hypothetical protein
VKSGLPFCRIILNSHKHNKKAISVVTKGGLFYSFIINSIPMKKNPMYYDVQSAKIHKAIYRPSSNIIRFVKALLAVIMLGNSPISTPSTVRRKFHQ